MIDHRLTTVERLTPSFRAKVWGSTGLMPWFPDSAEKIGEVWFESERLPLIKFLFTSERLSVQVHPDDAYAGEHENSLGKTEMWHILRTSPGAKVGVGFQHRITVEQLRESALGGTIEAHLNWIQVRPGDSIFVPARTVHAIGAGLVLCEIQERSDVTYRIFDYGRGRELHLDRAAAIANLDTSVGRSTLPLRCPHFHTERYTVHNELVLDGFSQPSGLIVLDGEGLLNDEPFLVGEVWEIPPDTTVTVRGKATMLRTYIP